MLPVEVKAPVAGLYSSALERKQEPLPGGLQGVPPATNTIPFCNSVAVCPNRPVARIPVTLKVCEDGLNTSALER
jgi:hypothetical protein